MRNLDELIQEHLEKKKAEEAEKKQSDTPLNKDVGVESKQMDK